MRKAIGILATPCLFGALVYLSAAEPQKGDKMRPNIDKKDFGKSADGHAVDLFTLTNAHGVTAKIMTYGGIITELHAPDREGKFADVVLGFGDLESYLAGHPMFGALVGRVANRIAGGKFTLHGKDYTLAVNSGPNSIHGGRSAGYSKSVSPGFNVSTGPVTP